MTTVCGALLFAGFPGLLLLVLLGDDVDELPWDAVLFSMTALMLACIAGLFAGGLVSDKVRARRRAAGGHGGEGGDGGAGTGADADTGGFDAD
ncbi:hypothetical protein [Streptomyces sp. NPDC093089]|uniref:hypothetical protein n=1 Tax=Streptomyces sp. NPDC093089 TaxID=3366024 RepID=UPI00380383DD